MTGVLDSVKRASAPARARLRGARELLALVRSNLLGKLAARRGRPRLSTSCQIGPLLSIYRDNGFLDRPGHFLEIGAFDGETFSNTSVLADLGWHGIYVEPIAQQAFRCRLRHALNREVRVVEAAIGATRGQLMLEDMGALTSGKDAQVELYGRTEWAASAFAHRRQRAVPAILLDDLPLAGGRQLDLMVIDVEGMETVVWEQMRRLELRPRMLIVELVDQHADFAGHALADEHRSLREQILAAGYDAIFVDSINSIFRRREPLHADAAAGA